MTPTAPDGPDVHPMSFEQESIWLQDQFREGRSRYLESWIHRLRGPVDAAAVRSALTAVVAHQEALRSRLGTQDGRPVQTVLPPSPVPLDERWVAPEDLETALLAAITRPVPLDCPPLLRASLLRVAEDDAVLALAVHHAVMDGWSARLLDEQISTAYRAAVDGHAPELPDIPLQFGPYARRQRADDEVTSPDHLAHWRAVLADAPAESAFPADRPRPARPGHRGGEVRFTVDGGTGKAIRGLARAARATPFVVLASALTALLCRMSGQYDVVLGTPVSRRTGTEVKSLVGCLTDVMPLRTRTAPERTFADLVASVKSTVWAAVRHRHIPYGHLVREFATDRALGRFPLFQVVLTLDDETGEGLTFPGVTSERLYRHAGRSKFDVFLNLVPDGDGYRGFLEYSADLFDRPTAQRLADRFAVLLADAVSGPDTPLGELNLMTPDEPARLDAWSEGPRPPAVPPLAHLALLPHADRDPGAPAAVLGRHTLTYGELDARAGAVAAGLTALGRAGERVGVCLGRTLDMPVAVLGVLRAGASVVPVDPAGPQERTAFVLRDAGVRTVVTDDAHAARLARLDGLRALTLEEVAPAGPGGPVAPEPPAPDAPAYVLYTSGSTGRPKGVAVPHRSLANLVDWQRRDSRLRPGARNLQFAPLTFDVAFQEILATWAAGGTLVLADEAARRDPARLLDLLHEQRVARLILPFVALQQLAEHAALDGRFLHSLQEVATSGEQLYVTPVLRRMFSASCRATLQNQYGPTETHVVTALRLTGDPAGWPERPGIGRPVDGARVRVRDGALRPQPVGVPGEICVAGAPVALGYLGHAADAPGGFVPDPDDDGGRLYRTGDLGRLLADGAIEYLGRDDGQVKIHGHRVELQEAEAAVRRIPGVRDAVVLARTGTTSADARLVAHYVPAPGARVSPASVRAYLRSRLPAPLVPAVVRETAGLPLTASGKVDRAALARETPRSEPPADRPGSPAGTTRQRLTRIWEHLLDLPPGTVAADDDFFRLGGESFLGARLMLGLREEFGVRLGLDAVYASPTVAGLADLIEADTAGASLPSVEARLADDIVPGPAAAQEPVSEVLLTGATGFLGAFVLRELLARTAATVHCLVRAHDDAQAARRLREAAERYGLWTEETAVRAVPVAGDLAQPLMGLDPRRHDALARTVDAVYHCGASVNLALPYAELAAVNVGGTEEVLRLAALHRTVPVHHVSTVGVLSGEHLLDRPVTEREPLTPVGGLRHGYARSKWAAERLVEQARERGLPVTVHRPTRISGDHRTGACQPADFLWLLLKGCLQAGLYPDDVPIAFDLVPVDYVAGAVVALSLDPATGPVVQLAEGDPVPLTVFATWLTGLGYRLDPVPYAHWSAVVERDPGNAAFPLLGVMAPGMVSTSGSGAARFDGSAARSAAASHGVALHPMDGDVFLRHVRYFTSTGFLPRPV